MKVCILTTVHDPFDSRVFHKEAKSLAKMHEVTLIAPDEKKRDKEVDGIKIITIKKPKSKVFHPITMWRVFKAGFIQNCDVYHCHEPDSMIIGVFLKILKRKKVIYDVHEHWPSEISYGWFKIKNKTLDKVIQWISLKIELFFSKFVDCIIAVSDSVAERFKERAKDIYIIPNVPLPTIVNLDNIGKDNEVVQMSGGLQSFHGVNENIVAISKVKNEYPDIKLKIIGNVLVDIDSMVKNYHLENNIIFTGYLPYKEMYKEISRGKIGFLTLKSDYYNIYIGLPNKLFDYMLCGLPVVASNFPEISKVIKEADCGILVDPTNVDEIADAVIYLIEHPEEAERMGENGRRVVVEKYNWGKMEERLLKIYEELK
ncbi:MAG: putative glycosyl transferase [Candidatus Syntrophoarchaeum sp. GoM_oil]|nr:MAG: putative glycosyl transferase [Candidatus Syntrophoarchaeum sp. GoM_oil]